MTLPYRLDAISRAQPPPTCQRNVSVCIKNITHGAISPVILGSLPRQTGRCAPPPIAASYSKDKNNLPIYNSGCLREGPFQLYSTTEAREYIRVPGLLSSRPHWVPPPPQLQKSVAFPLWIQGGRHTHIRMRGWGGGPIPTMGHTLWHSRPSHRSFAELSGEQ
jgi:hypothetical protein